MANRGGGGCELLLVVRVEPKKTTLNPWTKSFVSFDLVHVVGLVSMKLLIYPANPFSDQKKGDY
jgi:hypothetical protein